MRTRVEQADIDAGTGHFTAGRAQGGDGAVAGERPAQRRRRRLEAGNGSLREGDPVKMDPFIEAQEDIDISILAGTGLQAAVFEYIEG